MIKVK